MPAAGAGQAEAAGGAPLEARTLLPPPPSLPSPQQQPDAPVAVNQVLELPASQVSQALLLPATQEAATHRQPPPAGTAVTPVVAAASVQPRTGRRRRQSQRQRGSPAPGSQAAEQAAAGAVQVLRSSNKRPHGEHSCGEAAGQPTGSAYKRIKRQDGEHQGEARAEATRQQVPNGQGAEQEAAAEEEEVEQEAAAGAAEQEATAERAAGAAATGKPLAGAQKQGVGCAEGLQCSGGRPQAPS